MIDQRTFLARSTVATALAAVGIQQGGAQAAALDTSHLLRGYLMAYDSDREAVVSGTFELWTTATGCAFVMGNRQGEERRQIVFDSAGRDLGLYLHDAADPVSGALPGRGQ